MGKISDALDRLGHRIKDWIASLEEALAPEPEPVPIPVVVRPTKPRL